MNAADTSNKPLSSDTPIEDVVASPRAIKALKAKGMNTIGDIKSLSELAALPGVSAGVLSQLEELGARREKLPSPDAEIEEGTHPVVLRSKHAGYIIRLLGGGVVPAPIGMPGRPSITQPLAIMFKGGAAELTREAWVTMRHSRDALAINAELSLPVDQKPWRGEAIRWLRGKVSHRRGDFVVLE